MPLKGTIKAVLSLIESKVGDLGTAQMPVEQAPSWSVVSGTGAGQADVLYQDQVSQAQSTTHTLDLAGVLAGIFGNTLTFARVKGLYVKASPLNPGNLQVTRPASSGVPLFAAAGDAIILRPGSGLLWWADEAVGIVVTAGSADLITIVSDATAGTYIFDVALIGASA